MGGRVKATDDEFKLLTRIARLLDEVDADVQFRVLAYLGERQRAGRLAGDSLEVDEPPRGAVRFMGTSAQLVAQLRRAADAIEAGASPAQLAELLNVPMQGTEEGTGAPPFDMVRGDN